MYNFSCPLHEPSSRIFLRFRSLYKVYRVWGGLGLGFRVYRFIGFRDHGDYRVCRAYRILKVFSGLGPSSVFWGGSGLIWTADNVKHVTLHMQRSNCSALFLTACFEIYLKLFLGEPCLRKVSPRSCKRDF